MWEAPRMRFAYTPYKSQQGPSADERAFIQKDTEPKPPFARVEYRSGQRK